MENKGGGKKITVIKSIEDSDKSVSAIPPNNARTTFEPMPQLYLELLENKEKIKQNLINKEYEPDDNMSDISYFNNAPGSMLSNRASTAPAPIREEDDELMSTDVSVSEKEDNEASDDAGRSDDDVDDDADDLDDDVDDDVNDVDDNADNKVDDNVNDDIDQQISDPDEYESGSLASETSSVSMPGRAQPRPPVPQPYEEMLNKSQPPRLADLKKAGEYVANDKNKGHVPDLHRIYSRSAEEEEEIKREILFKFEILKKSYRNLDIPNYTIHTDLKTLTRGYENTLRRVSLDTNVDSYKQYLIGGFMLVEFVASNWLSLDMQGFTQQQILNMNQYERLLIELGEKSYVPGGKGWPVEVRLLGMIIMNAAIFIISKIIMKKTGNNLVNMMNSFSKTQTAPSKPVSTSNDGNKDTMRRRMRGPSIDPDDIPDIGISQT